jgi:hypothetical protein
MNAKYSSKQTAGVWPAHLFRRAAESELSLFASTSFSGPLQQRIHARIGILEPVLFEVQFRNPAKSQTPAYFAPKKRPRSLERAESLLLLRCVSGNPNLHARVPPVGADVDVCDVHETGTRIVHFKSDNLRKLLAQRFGHSPRAPFVHTL